MTAQALLPFAIATGALVLLLVLLVGTKRLSRVRTERGSRDRLARLTLRLASGDPGLVRAAIRSGATRRAQVDLAAALDLVLRESPPVHVAALHDALAGSAAERVALAGLASRRRTRLTRAVVLASAVPTIPPAAFAPLLEHDDPDIRLAAVRAIARRETPESARLLAAALAGGRVPPERVVERLAAPWSGLMLVEALAETSDPEARAWIAEAIGLGGEQAAAPALVGLLMMGGAEERTRACRALGRLGLRATVSVLVKALGDPEEPVRAQALRALGQIGDPRAAAPIAACLGDASWWVRANAGTALAALGEQGAAELRAAAAHHPDPYARERAAEALATSRIPAALRKAVA